ncbi:tensin-4-like isoform X1 [Phyllopteryx taeniolatus]|uniref:tensin-4-like isoform X1 n=1 Tax=Phyllopteryx taeniolatus TaxID=161469 RepID=UPI002AD27058|nr:tensin-4-like isoform X1 [Phyllopteryx taeniolatus]
MMPIAEGMSHIIPNHVLRVGQTIRLDPQQETITQCSRSSEPSSCLGDVDLDISLDNLNQLMLEMDPTFEPIQVNNNHPCISPTAEGCCSSPTVSPGIPIPRTTTVSFSPPGTLVFSDSPSRPPLPCGSAPRRNPSMRHDITYSQASQRLSYPNRNSAASLLSTSTCSDTSYILGSTLSLASEDADGLGSILSPTSGAYCDGCRARYYIPQDGSHKQGQEMPTNCSISSPEQSLSGSFTDIPMLLINGVPHQDNQESPSAEDKVTLKPFTYHGSEADLSGSQSSMKFVMDSSKFWFRPHISRAEAEAFVKDKEPGRFVVRDSTTYRGCFGLAMKVDQTVTSASEGIGGESSSQLVKHFLIESTAKGVRLKGSPQEPYFGSLSALVFQHTISTFALPCKLLLHSQGFGGEEERIDKSSSEEKKGTACNFIYLNAVPTEMLTGPCAVQRAVSFTFQLPSGSFEPAIVNLKVSLKGITLTDINRKQFFRRHYPAHLLSYGGNDPEDRRWIKGSKFGARMFGFVAKGVEAGMGNICHVFAEYDPLQPCSTAVGVIKAVIAKSYEH